MNKYSGLDVKNKLLNGCVIYLVEDGCYEKRLYRYNNSFNIVEYSDDYLNWKPSSMQLDDFTKNHWSIFKE